LVENWRKVFFLTEKVIEFFSIKRGSEILTSEDHEDASVGVSNAACCAYRRGADELARGRRCGWPPRSHAWGRAPPVGSILHISINRSSLTQSSEGTYHGGTLLQNIFVVSAVNTFVVSATVINIILRIRKIECFCVGCCRPLTKINFQY
jgi:hypothetical protein